MISANDRRFAAQHAQWRDPADVVARGAEAVRPDPALLAADITGPWWDLLAEAGVTLLLSREYEHLVLGLSSVAGQPHVSLLPLPHPSGIAFDPVRGEVHIASTRNPNALYTLQPANGLEPRADLEAPADTGRPLMPTGARFLPGSLYLHDLAIVDGALLANAVGSNAVIDLSPGHAAKPVWWPSCIDGATGPAFELNHLQLNGIAAGPTLRDSYFTASTDRIATPRPGHPDFAVEGRGVVFSGETHEPILRGLTRPHSPRFVGGALWLDNSGYGTLVSCADGRAEIVTRLPGWTRGLCDIGDHVIVGTSRILPRFAHYAPGLDAEQCCCGLHAVEIATGRVTASMVWPSGNQIFAIEAVPTSFADGLPFHATGQSAAAERTLFYAWRNARADDRPMENNA
jgi:uncharacterized protein (TIGR03032 family)